MTFRELPHLKSYGIDLQGFFAQSRGKRYDAYCISCGRPIKGFAPDPMDEYPDYVECVNGHYVHYEDIVIHKVIEGGLF